MKPADNVAVNAVRPVEVVSVFLDDPITGLKSSIRVEFSPVAELQTLADTVFYITKLGPIPFLLCQQGDVDTKEVAVESIGGPTKLIFRRDPPTGNPGSDLAEILQWFEKSDVAVELLPIDVIKWFPQQFTGATHWLGIAIEPGWVPIVADVCQQIQSTLTSAERSKFHWIQIKQDWGKLMMYWEPRHRIAVCTVSPIGGLEFVTTADGSRPFHDQDADLARIAAAKKEFDELITREMDISATARQRVDEIIAIAQDRASRTCEHCGAAGKLRYQPTISVLCDGCQEGWEQALSEEFAVASG